MKGPSVAENPAILLLAFGAPSSTEEVEPFLKSIFQDQPLPPGIVEEVRSRYEAIGGSPLVEITKGQAQDLEEELRRLGIPSRVYVAMRHSRPSIGEVVRGMYGEGVRGILAVVMSPFQSRASIGGYVEEVERVSHGMEIRFVRPWHNHPLFLDALSKRIRETKAGSSLPFILFTAHSLPEDMVGNDPYTHQIRETVDGVLRRLTCKGWAFAYQSKGRRGRWLGPPVEEVIEDLSVRGEEEVILVPLSFVADNIETLYDIDVIYKGMASRLGIHLHRVPAFNRDPSFLKGLARIIEEDLRP